jgi:arylsulfatase
MTKLGYRTFGVGKFHTTPWDAPLGFEVHLHSEEFYLSSEQRAKDSYASWIARQHPEFDFIEALMGERVEMYYMPQMSPLPASLNVEAWATDQALAEITRPDEDPWFGFLSYIGPHPPFAPPIPYNRMYDPDDLPAPEPSDPAVDYLDDQIPWMNYAVYAESVDSLRARVLKARYFGEITFIDSCIGRILDALETRSVFSDTLICFFSDHGDLLGDHNGWQKENYFEAATHIPFLLTWPGVIPGGSLNDSLVSLEDVFGVATRAAGGSELRDGIDVVGVARGSHKEARECLVGVYGTPGTEHFKAMVRYRNYKLIWLANGGTTLLFDLREDPGEHRPILDERGIEEELVGRMIDTFARKGVQEVMDGGRLRALPFRTRERVRIRQFDRSRGVEDFGLDGF